jgi:hypothetical protein
VQAIVKNERIAFGSWEFDVQRAKEESTRHAARTS